MSALMNAFCVKVAFEPVAAKGIVLAIGSIPSIVIFISPWLGCYVLSILTLLHCLYACIKDIRKRRLWQYGANENCSS